MLRSNLERQFDAWRRRGDAAALARVFDRAAPELMRLAVHLVHDATEAEDVVQATFLTAIERAASFDSERPLLPWLVGILVNQARTVRRRRPAPGPVLDGPGREPDPAEQAADDELSGELDRALAGLPAPYGEVLTLYLVGGRRAVEIAREVGRPAGTIRMQVHRGLTLLRRALPPGFAVGAAAMGTPARGLDAVRAEVLARAGVSAGQAASTGASAAGGALALAGKLALAAALVLVAVRAAGVGREGDEGTEGPAAAVAASAPTTVGEGEEGEEARVLATPSAAANPRGDVAGASTGALAARAAPSDDVAPDTGARLRGRVEGPRADEMAAVRLEVRGAARYEWPAELAATGRPAPDGSFELDVAELLAAAGERPASVSLVLSADHPAHVPVETRVEAGAAPVRVALPRAAVVRGRLAPMTGEVPVAALRLVEGAPVGPAVAETRSADDGSFALRLPSGDEHVVVALPPERLPVSWRVRAAPGSEHALSPSSGAVGDTPGGAAEAGAGATVAGRASCAGRPLAGAEVELRRAGEAPELSLLGRELCWEDGRLLPARARASCDGQGRFELTALAPGRHELALVALAGGAAVLPGSVAPRALDAPASGLELAAELAYLELAVVDGAGSALEARVQVRQEGAVLECAAGERVGLRPGLACSVRVEASGHEPHELELAAPACGELHAERFVLRSTRPTAVTFELVGLPPPAQVALELQPLDGGGRATGGPSSLLLPVVRRCVQVEVPAGRYRAALFAESSAAHYDAFLLPARSIVEPGPSGLRRQVELALGGRLRVRATDREGRPLETSCTVLDAAGREQPVRFLAFRPEGVSSRPARLWAVESNDVHPNLPAGDYRLELRAPGCAPASSWARLEAGRASTVEVVLVAGDDPGIEPGRERDR